MLNKLVTGSALAMVVLMAGLTSLTIVDTGYAAPKKVLVTKSASKLKKFTSAGDFKSYLNKAATRSFAYGGMMTRGIMSLPNAAAVPMMDSAAGAIGASEKASVPADRYSSTNVQVVGIDEPDIVKNDGQNIFLSNQRFPIYYATPMMGIRAPNYYPYNSGNVKIVNALPATDLKELGKIAVSGNLLLQQNILMVFWGNLVTGYDVKDKANPKELWKITLGSRESLISARLYNGKLFLATQSGINYSRPCPYEPMVSGNVKITIPCGGIYHPINIVPTDIIYTVSSVNVSNGTVDKKASFTGSNGYSQLYMSPNAMYITYFNPGDQVKFNYNFLSQNKDLVPADVLSRLQKLLSYDLSDTSKQNEFSYIISNWQNGLDQDELLKLQNEFKNRMVAYYPLHERELENTNIVKTSIPDFVVQGVGTVPGKVLNQYSMDEYNNNLRVAVTIGQTTWYLGSVYASTKSYNDVYVLDNGMTTVGSVKDLGEGEQIYAARFIGDRGYVVTFRQTDPLYTLDLSNPRNPTLAGELKVPGYSSYLEPIGDHLILGVGKEDNQVKAALYDVGDAKNPKELSKYILNEYWSDAVNNPHAFLRDDKHKIFFIPGSQGGYIFSYKDNTLSLAKAVSDYSVQRAIYINDTFYVIGQNKISAWDENTWTKLNDLTWNNYTDPSPTPVPMNGSGSSVQGSSGTAAPLKSL